MKNRKTVVVAFLLVAAMLLGVGYATLSDQLFVNGTAGVDADDSQEAFEGDVYFSKVISGEGCEAIIDETADTSKDTGKITVAAGALKEVGDEVIATYTIKSESDLDVLVSLPTKADGTIENSNETYFSVTPSWDGDKTLPAGGTIDVTITVKLIKTAVADQSVTFKLTFNAETVS